MVRAKAACSGCHRAFASVRAFDAHRSHHGQHGSCVNPEIFGLEQVNGVWRFPVIENQEVAPQ